VALGDDGAGEARARVESPQEPAVAGAGIPERYFRRPWPKKPPLGRACAW
jgi:hypothetical protein